MLVNQYAFASDIFAALLALNASVNILHPDGKQIDMPLDVFQHYDMKNKIIHSITVPWAKQEGGFELYKAMLRHVNSHAIINAGMLKSFCTNDFERNARHHFDLAYSFVLS